MTHLTQSSQNPRERPRILVIDDEESILFALREYLTLRGFQVETVAETDEAQALLAHRQYDLLIVDLQLNWSRPTGGLDLVRFAQRRFPDTRIVMLTAYGSDEIQRRAYECGADVFLTKPHPLEDIAKIVSALVSRGSSTPLLPSLPAS